MPIANANRERQSRTQIANTNRERQSWTPIANASWTLTANANCEPRISYKGILWLIINM
jgi:hypothetical protein